MHLPKVILLPFFDKFIALATARPQRWPIWSKIQGSTVNLKLNLKLGTDCCYTFWNWIDTCYWILYQLEWIFWVSSCGWPCFVWIYYCHWCMPHATSNSYFSIQETAFGQKIGKMIQRITKKLTRQSLYQTLAHTINYWSIITLEIYYISWQLM